MTLNRTERTQIIGNMLSHRRGDGLISYDSLKRSFIRYLNFTEAEWLEIAEENGWNNA